MTKILTQKSFSPEFCLSAEPSISVKTPSLGPCFIAFSTLILSGYFSDNSRADFNNSSLSFSVKISLTL